jgi:hypothetical protein
VITAALRIQLESLPALPAARRLEKCSPILAKTAGMSFSLAIESVIIATSLFDKKNEPTRT